VAPTLALPVGRPYPSFHESEPPVCAASKLGEPKPWGYLARDLRGPGRPANTKGTLAMSKLDTEQRHEISNTNFAFPNQRKEPLEDASHVRNAIARFDQVQGVSDAERDEAWHRIKTAAKKYGVDLKEESWRDLKKGPRK
jgi:hypothetical protein